MTRYLRNIQPFAGVSAPAVTRLANAAAGAVVAPSVGNLSGVVAELFAGRWREERYAAFRVAVRCRAWRWPEALPVFESMIRQGPWWDGVDAVAGRLIGPLLLEHPHLLERVFGYIPSPDLWFRRTALLAQLKFKQQTDTAVLAGLIGQAASDPDFFIRKAIGWALREYAKSNPAWVRRFVQRHWQALSPLSRKEALKNLANCAWRVPSGAACFPPGRPGTLLETA
jgi:3-methyladenine DNA glycosylase AlkD